MVAFALWRRCPAAMAASIGLLMAAIAAAPAAEQDRFPQRPIRLIVPFTAGGAYDVVARLIAEAMSKNLGGSVVVENRPGAGGNIAAEAVARSAPPVMRCWSASRATLSTQRSIRNCHSIRSLTSRQSR